MDWDQRAFAWIYRGFRRVTGKDQSAESESMLEPVLGRLETLSKLLSGEHWAIVGSTDAGGVATGQLFLPHRVKWAQEPEQAITFYLYRTLFGVTASEMGLCESSRGSKAERAAAMEQSVPIVEEAMRERYPGAASLIDEFRCVCGEDVATGEGDDLPWGLYLEAKRVEPVAGEPPDDPKTALPSGTERELKKRSGEVEHVDLESQRDQDNPVVHSFEKVHSADEYEQGRKQLDGSDELAAHEDALKELDLHKVVRTSEPTRSVYRADFHSSAGTPEVSGDAHAGRAYPYPEWDFQSRSYRDDWCTVNESIADAAPFAVISAASRRLHPDVLRLQAELKRLDYERRWRNRQLDGTDIDIDAMVDRQATLAAKRTPDPRVYLRRKQHATDLAVLVLIDASLSSDSWMAGQRIFDVERDVAQTLLEAFQPTGTPTALAAFHSNTRRDCRFVIAKHFHEPVGLGLQRLHAITPAGYTRVGPALRHAAQLMQDSPARRRLVVLVTDAKPTDYDRYEGRYGVEDVRQAVREASQWGVRCAAMTTRNKAEPYLSTMFGANNWTLLPNLRALPGCFVSTITDFLKS